MRGARSSSRAAVVTAAIAALGLAGCGSSKPPLAAAVAAATKTLDLRAAATVTLDGSTAFGPTSAAVVGRGLFDLPRGLGYSAVNLPGSSTRPASPAYLVFLPAKVYLMPVQKADALGKGKLWVSISTAGTSPPAFPHLAAQTEDMNPQFLLDELAWGARSATGGGGEVVNHVPMTAYTVTVDLKKALAHAEGAAVRRAIEEQLALAPGGSSTMQVSESVNGPGLVTRLQFAAPGTGLGTVTIALTRFNASFTETLPLRSQVVDVGAAPRTPLAPWILEG